ncbi:MAG TPA: zf-HC2 domain-containing protein [Acidimicrobiales bacterium]|nr:zf-HC2 domain-containing protein [Acidimicrobiales bacterium]
MDCQTLFEHLTDFLEGSLTPEQEQLALEHLATCPRCETVLDQTREVTRLLAEHGRITLEGERRQELLHRILQSTR